MAVIPFHTRPDASTFDPDSIRILSDAFEDAWQSLHTTETIFHLEGHAETRPSITLPRQLAGMRATEATLDCPGLVDTQLLR